MKIKKTWFSYLAWFIFSVYTGILLAVYLSAYGSYIWSMDKYAAIFLVCGVFAACGGVWFLGRKVSEFAAGRITGDAHLFRMWEYFLVMCIFAGAALYRIYLILHSVETAEAGAGILSRLMLQLTAILSFYLAVRFMAGRVEALLASAILAFLPSVSREIFYLSPEPLYLLLYFIGLLLLGRYAARKSHSIIFALTGIYCGIMGYLDIAGWTLLLFALVVSARKAVLMLSAVASMVLCICIDGVITGSTAGSVIVDWWGAHAPSAAELHVPSGPDGVLAVSVFICMCAAFGIIGFWFHKGQKQDAWILLLAAVLVLDMMNAGQMEYHMLIAAIWSVLAGIGITSMGIDTHNKERVLQELIVEEITEDECSVNTKNDCVVCGMGYPEDTVKSMETSTVRFIDNPLPLPKKHVKKEMDYNRSIENTEMKFDISISENDDFDI